MKPFVIVLIMSILPLLVMAQQENLQKKADENQVKIFKPDSDYHKLSNEFDTKREIKTPPLSQKKMFESLNDQQSDFAVYRMPVLKPGNYSSKMPVVVPDSSVNYYLKIKKPDGINPKETKH